MTDSVQPNSVPVAKNAADELNVLRAAYLRAGQSKTDAELQGLLSVEVSDFTFDPAKATEADIVGLIGTLGLTDASLPAPAAPVSLTRTLPTDTFATFGTAPDITGLSISQLGALLDSGAITSREIVLQYLYRIQAYDHAGPALRSVAQINPDILKLADQADAERAAAKAAGQTLPPLFGIPLLVKNNIDTLDTNDDFYTDAGSAALIGSSPTDNAFVIKQLTAQGAIVMGKTNMDEWAGFRDGHFSTGTGGMPLNPFDPSDYVIGSSTGSGIAAAMHFAPATIGTETNGSIIGPSEGNHIYALKPTQGVVSRTGVIPGVSILDTVGPMGNSVRDLATMLDTMATPDPTDPLSATSPARPSSYTSALGGDLSGLTIGIFTGGSPGASVTQNLLTDSEKDSSYSFLNETLGSSKAQVKTLSSGDFDTAFKQSLSNLSDQDAAVFCNALFNGSLPPGGVEQALAIIRSNPQYGATLLTSYVNNNNVYPASFTYLLKKGVDADLGGRKASPADYQSAFVKLLGDKFNPLNGDTNSPARSEDDVAAFDDQNPQLEYSDEFDWFKFLANTSLADLAKAAGYSSPAAFDAAIAEQRRVSVEIMTGIRQALGVDVIANVSIGGTEFDQTTYSYAMSPQLSLPITLSDGTVVNVIFDANPYQETSLLQVGDYIDRQLATPDFSAYKAAPPAPPVTGFGRNQPPDSGPLLPFVIDDLDDHGQATPAHLLSTVMAPLTLNATSTATVPDFDGTISGDGGLIKEGVGTQRLSGTSDFTGAIQIWQGTLEIDSAGALGAAGNALTLQQGSELDAGATLTLADDVTLVNGGTLGAESGATLTQAGTVSGNGGLTKTGAGSLILSGTNTYTGGLTIAQGGVATASDQGFGQDYGALTFDDATSLSVTASFTTHRQVHLTGVATIDLATGTVLTATNVLDGSGGLKLSGQGKLDLAGTGNLYSGGTYLDGATLELGSMTAAGTGAITFGAGPELLEFDTGGSFADTILGFNAGDVIDLQAIAFKTATFTYANGLLSVSDGSETDNLKIAQGATGSNFVLAADGFGGTKVTETPGTTPTGTIQLPVPDTTSGSVAVTGSGSNDSPAPPPANPVTTVASLDPTSQTIESFYYTLFDRPAETGGLTFWDQIHNAHPNERNLLDVASQLLHSHEYEALHGAQTDKQFVEALYEGAFGRTPEASALHHDVFELRHHEVTRAALAVSIVESHEAKSLILAKAAA